jgi:glycosyltransferase involved in cell wall biosynthesis
MSDADETAAKKKKVLKRIVENRLINKLSYEEYRDHVRDVYDGRQGSFLLTCSRRLATADALVLPSSLEGWGIAATEAIRAGTPVIASGATAEALASCTPAVIFFGDVREGLVDALSDFTRSSALRRELAVNALAFGARLPTWASCIDAFRRAAQPPDG